jgi:hypothetical protein
VATVEVRETALASAQAAALRGAAASAYERFLDDLAHRGCAALAYRLSGPVPLERLCVKHLRGSDRVVVAFEGQETAWVLLVGAHRDSDPGRDFYEELYRLAGLRPPSDQRRTKPPCCDASELSPVLDDEAIDELVRRARELRGRGGRVRKRAR